MTIDVPERGARVEGEQPPPKSVGRRTVLAGAAWTVPAVALATAAPAHAASGVVLAFDKNIYGTVGCGTLDKVKVSVRNGSQPVPGVEVTINLPRGFSFVKGGDSVIGQTNNAGIYELPTINVPAETGMSSMTALAQSLTATAAVSVVPNTSAQSAIEGVIPADAWSKVPRGSKPIGANFFLSPSGDLWFENTFVVGSVASAAGWYYTPNGNRHADYVLENGEKWRASWTNPTEYKYTEVPVPARPVGEQYFLTDSGDLYYYETLVVANVKSIATWSDNSSSCADIELNTGVLIRARGRNIEATFSPMPPSAKPIGADYFLSDDGDLFFQRKFVATQVLSAVGWNSNDHGLCADYMNTRGQALTAQGLSPRTWSFPKVPAGAKPIGAFYFLTDDGDLYYWTYDVALTGVDTAVAYDLSSRYFADVRMKSGAAIRLEQYWIDHVYSPMPVQALPIGACYFFDAENQELYYQHKIVATGVVDAAGWHWVGGGDFADYVTERGEVLRAGGGDPRNLVYTKIPATATPLGWHYFLDKGVLYWYDRVVVRTVKYAVARNENGNTCADFQLESGASARARNENIEATYSPMPLDASDVGADYFLTQGGELYNRGKLVATEVVSALGQFSRFWSTEYCNYVTKDGIGYRAGQARPRDETFSFSEPLETALSGGYFLAASKRLYLWQNATNFTVQKIATWTDGNPRADILTANGTFRTLANDGVADPTNDVYPNVPTTARPVGCRYFLTASGDLWFMNTKIATGVADAVGWYDISRDLVCADYRLISAGGSPSEYKRAERDNATAKSYGSGLGQPALLGFGYFLTESKTLRFEDAEIAANVISGAAWTDGSSDNLDGSSSGTYRCTYRTEDGKALRAQRNNPTSQQWIEGNTPLDAKLVGVRSALSSDGQLWFDGKAVADDVVDAVGWWYNAEGAMYIDYSKNNIAYRLRVVNGQPVSTTYGAVTSATKLLGYGYYLTGTTLWFQGQDIRSSSAIGATSGAAWADGGNHFCDYRTSDLAAYRATNEKATDYIWDTGLTPLGSEPRGASYYFLADGGVLSLEGKIVATGLTEALGWENQRDGLRYADVRDGNGNAARAEIVDSSKPPVLNFTVYVDVPSASKAVGAGYWLKSNSELFFAGDRVAPNVAMARGWTDTSNPPQVANYRFASGTASRARGKSANGANPAWEVFSTPLHSKPIGSEYFLAKLSTAGTFDLYFRGKYVVTAVSAATGWHSSNENAQYADYMTESGEAYRARADNFLDSSFTDVPVDAVPVGAGYFLAEGGQLYFENTEFDQAVTAAIGWATPDKRVVYAKEAGC